MQQERDKTGSAQTPARAEGLASLLSAFYSTRGSDALKGAMGDVRFFAKFCGVDETQVAEVLFGATATKDSAEAVVRRYVDSMRQESFAHGTINRRVSVIRTLSHFARLKGVVRWELEVPTGRAPKSRDARGASMAAVDRAQAMEHKDDAKSRRDAAITLLIHELKLNRAETVAIDLERYDPDPRHPAIDIDGNRTPISIRLKRALDRWIEERGFKPGRLFVKIERSGPDASSPLSPDDVLPLVRANPQIACDDS